MVELSRGERVVGGQGQLQMLEEGREINLTELKRSVY